MPYGINEHYPPALTLIKSAHDFLVEYVTRDDLHASRHELAAAATDVVFSASYVDSEAKHELLRAVREKLQAVGWRAGDPPSALRPRPPGYDGSAALTAPGGIPAEKKEGRQMTIELSNNVRGPEPERIMRLDHDGYAITVLERPDGWGGTS